MTRILTIIAALGLCAGCQRASPELESLRSQIAALELKVSALESDKDEESSVSSLSNRADTAAGRYVLLNCTGKDLKLSVLKLDTATGQAWQLIGWLYAPEPVMPAYYWMEINRDESAANVWVQSLKPAKK